jgi:predicted acylesterase/phospholipase RssA
VSVVRDGARAVLASRLFGPDAPDALVHRSTTEDPRGFLAVAGADVDDWLWRSEDPDDPDDPGAPVPPLTDPRAYDLTRVCGVLSLDRLHRAPADAADLDERELDAYRRAGADVIMRGGTASGVVYPLALCEIARGMRLRSLGGASAGAIAAATGAAAELGRVRLDRARAGGGDPAAEPGDGPAPGGSAVASGSAAPDRRPDRFRSGFPGLADVAAWLSELDPDRAGGSPGGSAAARTAADGPGADRPPPEFRIAGLFQPAPAARPAFRLLVALLRGRTRAALALVPFAAGRLPTVLAALAAVASVPAVWAASPAALPRGAAGPLTALVLLAAVSAMAVGAVLVGLPRWRAPGALSAAVGLAIAIVVTIAMAGAGGRAVAGLWASTLGAWFLVAVVVVAVLLMPLLRFLGRAGERRYGFVAGADDPPAGGLGARLDALAGLPAGRPVTAWLEGVLDDLAGQQPDDVLRFGHLWLGDDYVPPEGRDPAATARVTELGEAAWRRPDRRLVDLRLVASEITQGLAYEIPGAHEEWGDDARTLLYRPEEWSGGRGRDEGRVVTDRVLRALEAASTPVTAQVRGETGTVGLRTLPALWDLPVVLAVRLSMALPVAFQAVPMYRRPPVAARTDEFGRPLPGDPPSATTPVVDRLWFSDGGLTSNFPVHFFDSLLPRWPTLGINLGTPPPDAPQQDVDLPADGAGRVRVPRSRPIGTGLRSFAAALFATSRNWRDTEVALRPAFAGRIAEVRLGPGEGDLNIFMPPATVAAVALRGVVAGARLRRRWRYDPIWQRHQWLRMREAVGTVHPVLAAGRRAEQVPPYDRLLAAPEDEVARIYASQRLGDPRPYRPAPGEPVEATRVSGVWQRVAAAGPPPEDAGAPPPDAGSPPTVG